MIKELSGEWAEYVCDKCGATLEAEKPAMINHPPEECGSGERGRFVAQE